MSRYIILKTIQTAAEAEKAEEKTAAARALYRELIKYIGQKQNGNRAAERSDV